MSPRIALPTQPPLPPFKKEVDAAYVALMQRQKDRRQRNRELARERSRRYRARKAS
jgi:hypothetical protein